MKAIYKGSLLVALGLCLCLNLQAQDTTARKTDTVPVKKYRPYNVNLQLRNMYIWRGFRVSNSPITDVDMRYTTRDGSFSAGLWGGAGLNGEYREFDYYVSYAKKGWSFAVWDINNFTDFPNAKLFDYKRDSTSHFIDVSAAYQFGKAFPLSISWSTIVQGRDTHVKSDGQLGNNYSNYVQLDYKLWEEGTTNLHVYVAGGFAFGRDKSFYGDKPNIVNTGLTLNKELILFNHHMPVAATAMFSPEHNHGAIQLVINAF